LKDCVIDASKFRFGGAVISSASDLESGASSSVVYDAAECYNVLVRSLITGTHLGH
jgi:hypothetical protein